MAQESFSSHQKSELADELLLKSRFSDILIAELKRSFLESIKYRSYSERTNVQADFDRYTTEKYGFRLGFCPVSDDEYKFYGIETDENGKYYVIGCSYDKLCCLIGLQFNRISVEQDWNCYYPLIDNISRQKIIGIVNAYYENEYYFSESLACYVVETPDEPEFSKESLEITDWISMFKSVSIAIDPSEIEIIGNNFIKPANTEQAYRKFFSVKRTCHHPDSGSSKHAYKEYFDGGHLFFIFYHKNWKKCYSLNLLRVKDNLYLIEPKSYHCFSQTLEYPKSVVISSEILSLFAPIAQKLGIEFKSYSELRNSINARINFSQYIYVDSVQCSTNQICFQDKDLEYHYFNGFLFGISTVNKSKEESVALFKAITNEKECLIIEYERKYILRRGYSYVLKFAENKLVGKLVNQKSTALYLKYAETSYGLIVPIKSAQDIYESIIFRQAVKMLPELKLFNESLFFKFIVPKLIEYDYLNAVMYTSQQIAEWIRSLKSVNVPSLAPKIAYLEGLHRYKE